LDDGFVVCCFSVTFPQKPQKSGERESERAFSVGWWEKEQQKKEEVNNHIQ